MRAVLSTPSKEYLRAHDCAYSIQLHSSILCYKHMYLAYQSLNPKH